MKLGLMYNFMNVNFCVVDYCLWRIVGVNMIFIEMEMNLVFVCFKCVRRNIVGLFYNINILIKGGKVWIWKGLIVKVNFLLKKEIMIFILYIVYIIYCIYIF